MSAPPPGERRCSRCKKQPAAASHYWCRACQNKNHAAWEAAQAGLAPQYRIYVRAWNAVRQRVRRGRMQRQPCQRCGAARAVPMIVRPRLPYGVEWWCLPCRRRARPGRHYTGAPRRRAG